MLLLNNDATDDLKDLAKSVMICQHLNIDFACGEDEQGNVISVHPDGALAGLAIAFEIMKFPMPEITDQDVAEFCEINGI